MTEGEEHGAAPNGPPSGDVQSSLGALEGKLRELQDALSGVSGTELPPAHLAPAPPLSPPPSPPSPVPVPARSGVEARVHDVLAEAEAEAVRIVEDARARAAALSDQIDELVGLRDGLHFSARALLDEWEGALARAAGGATRAEYEPPPHFAGTVAVSVGPFASVDELGGLERGLTSIPSVERVAFRAFRRDRVTVDVTLGESVALVEELHRHLPFPIAGVEAEGETLTVTLARPDGA